MKQKVAILGASDNPTRFAYKAQRLLEEYGHEIFPIGPNQKISNLPGPVDTLTLYVSAKTSDGMIDEIVKARPGRVLFNPGTENSKLESALRAANIPVVFGCTLVMLRGSTF